ncbi:hypothetical protein [Arcobacter sp. CECT 8986]|uniref:hypothetical protein n=1 Tax=Arcobacter sp. CECT 8986 TaxID=2044507 RepID=UPI001009EF38|nr:hypothetical protein [Arcobacter sp. CECT 8986]
MKKLIIIAMIVVGFLSSLNAETDKYPSWCGNSSVFDIISTGSNKISRDEICTGEAGRMAHIVKDRFKSVYYNIRTKEQYYRYLNMFYNQYLDDKNAKPKKYHFEDYLELIFGLLAISFIVYVGMTGLFMGYNDFKRRF